MRIHFIGIGGVGISGLAKYLHFLGHKISGSDVITSKMSRDVAGLGIPVSIPHSGDLIDSEIELIVHSAVIKPSNPEIIRGKELQIKILSRAEALKFILKDKKVFSICGAHGKSTTGAMLSVLIEENSIIGAYNKTYGSNVKYCEGENLVFEADESDGSFLNSNPFYSIVTNCEPEHMEFYNYDYGTFYKSYHQFLEKSKKRVINAEDPFMKDLDLEAIRLYPSKDIKILRSFLFENEPFIEFSLKEFGTFSVFGFGEHIAIDASLSILTALDFGISVDEVRERLKNYRGIEKRFDILQNRDNFILIDDYGHHPTEIEATLGSAIQFAKMRGIENITAIWQPHKYSRTLDNIEHFQRCFNGVSKLIILPVWKAGEEEVEIDFKTLFSRYNLEFTEKLQTEKGCVRLSNGDKLESGLIIGFGAGDITYQLRK
ncbi:UDP-N-acetylmuramate--alanine ligase [Thiovulum sp. ES]|nr:UDP-N-acetylmuramate--alanine ligase [Thiovulum sp. ES]